MRHTIMLNLDEAHARQLNDLRQNFHLAAEDPVRLAIRLTHTRHKQKPDLDIKGILPLIKTLDYL